MFFSPSLQVGGGGRGLLHRKHSGSAFSRAVGLKHDRDLGAKEVMTDSQAQPVRSHADPTRSYFISLPPLRGGHEVRGHRGSEDCTPDLSLNTLFTSSSRTAVTL